MKIDVADDGVRLKLEDPNERDTGRMPAFQRHGAYVTASVACGGCQQLAFTTQDE